MPEGKQYREYMTITDDQRSDLAAHIAKQCGNAKWEHATKKRMFTFQGIEIFNTSWGNIHGCCLRDIRSNERRYIEPSRVDGIPGMWKINFTEFWKKFKNLKANEAKA